MSYAGDSGYATYCRWQWYRRAEADLVKIELNRLLREEHARVTEVSNELQELTEVIDRDEMACLAVAAN